MAFQLLLVAAGFTTLYFGGEVLVRYAAALARALRVNPLVIGLTVVAFGTSAPELAAAISATLRDSPDLAIGNVVGSNIANIGLILGLTVVVAPMVAERRFVLREVPFMIFTALVFLGFASTGSLDRWQAVVMIVLLAVFLWSLIRGGRITGDLEDEAKGSVVGAFLGSLLGLALLIGGAELTVTAAKALARQFGITERVIGLTVVAFGTSVPELAGCMVAAARKQTGLVLGNIVGSNIFNTLLILPVAMLMQPIAIRWRGGFGFDLATMLIFSLLLLFFFVGGRKLHRLEGAFLVVAYLAYVGVLASQSAI